MDRSLNKEILRLSVPSILANLTVPLVGFVDTAVAGHLHAEEVCGTLVGAASFIGAISLGAVLFNLIYWNFSFLRTGTGGLTAQAFGRGDNHESAGILFRGLALAFGLGLLVLALQKPFMYLAMLFVHGSSEVETLAISYFNARIWAAPATISMMAFSGWFVGMQDSMASMWKDFVVNGVNIVASIVLSLGLGPWKGMGFIGVAWGTVIAQYSGLLFCVAVCLIKYRRTILSTFRFGDFRDLMHPEALKGYFSMNLNLFGRSLFFTAIYVGYTTIATGFGDLMLSCSAIMMQLLMIFSFFTDGFAYAAEALTGRFIGARDRHMLSRSVKYTFIWSMVLAAIFIVVYVALGTPLLRMMTSDQTVVDACRQFLPWLMLMPPVGCAAFYWDGVFLGATASKGLRNSMIGAAVSFFAVWFAAKALLSPEGSLAMHILMAAYMAHLFFRSVYLSVRYKKEVYNFTDNEKEIQ